MKKDKNKAEASVQKVGNSAPKQSVRPQTDISVSKVASAPVADPFNKFAASVPADLKAPQNVAPKAAPNPVVGGAVLKPVAGGLQPIIAPKGQVQLQPVVVPEIGRASCRERV